MEDAVSRKDNSKTKKPKKELVQKRFIKCKAALPLFRRLEMTICTEPQAELKIKLGNIRSDPKRCFNYTQTARWLEAHGPQENT